MVYTFFLANIYDTTEVKEPRGWKDLFNVLDRDFKTHGVFFEYTDGTLKLGFDCDGKDILEAEYDANGVDGFYQFYVQEDGTTIFTGNIDFSTRDYDEDFIEFEVNNTDSETNIKNGAKKKINLNFQQTLDGDTVSKMNSFDSIYSLATKRYAQIIASSTGVTLDTQRSVVAAGQTTSYFNIGLSSTQSAEIQKFSTSTSFSNDEEIVEYWLTQETKGAYQFEFDYDIDVDVTGVQGSGTTSWSMNIILRADKATFTSPSYAEIFAGGGRQIASNTIGGAAYPNNGTLTVSGSTTLYIVSVPGTRWRIECNVIMNTTGNAEFDADTTINQFDMTITDKSADFPTSSDWYHIHEALNKNLTFLTGNFDYLYSDLLGGELQGYDIDGCLSNMYITNGSRIRNLTDVKKAPSFSLKDYINNINVIQAVGWGIEELESPAYLGIYDIYWVEILSGVAELRILGYDLTTEITAASKLSFYNHETITGTYVVSSSTYVSTYTRVFMDVSTNNQFYDNILGENPTSATNYYNIALTCDAATEYRERLRVENWEHFYGESELLDLGTVQEYNEKPFNEAIYNSVNIRFGKYVTDDDISNSLEAFNTQSEWALPVVNSENELDLKMSWIGSSIILSESRDRRASLKPTTSHSLDNDLFFCEKAPLQGTFTVDFNASTDEITFPADAYDNIVSLNFLFTISGATDGSNNKQYAIQGPTRHDVENDEYIVPMATTVGATRAADTVTITSIFVTNTAYKIESNDNILTSSGLTRPSYFMNQRRTMKRFLIRWGSYINSTLAYIVSTAQTIRNLFYVNNGDFTTEIDTYNLDSDCVNVLGSVTEDDNLSTDDLAASKFKPNLIMGTVKICDTDYDNIKLAHKNRYPSANYGYFSVTSPNGRRKTGWLLNLKRNPIDRIANFTLIENNNIGIGAMKIEQDNIIG